MSWTHEEWSALGDVLAGGGALGGAFAVLVAALIGSRTFHTWRKQKLSERLIDQAERILTATYKARASLSYIRSPIMLPHEFYAAEKKLTEDGQWPDDLADQGRLSTAQAYYIRLNTEAKVRLELTECQPMARALFGESLEMAIEELSHQFHTVRVFVDANARDRGAITEEFRNRIDGAIYEGYPDGDDNKNKMDQLIADRVRYIEGVCLPVLRLE